MSKNKFSKQFKDFILQGSIKEAIIGFTIGVAFKDMITALVDNIITPPIGFLLGRVSFDQLYIALSDQQFSTLAEAEASGVPIIRYGIVIGEIIDLLIIGLVIFIVIKKVLKTKI